MNTTLANLRMPTGQQVFTPNAFRTTKAATDRLGRIVVQPTHIPGQALPRRRISTFPIIYNEKRADTNTFIANVSAPALKEPRHLSLTEAAKRAADAVDFKVNSCG